MDAVRSILQPITHNLPGPIKDLGISIIGDKCYQSLINDINIEDVECIKYGVSKGLGIGIIGASSIVKVPQILKLVNSQSAEGISFLSYLLETVAYLITLAYNYRNEFPFSTYGETALILAQNVIISVLILRYSGESAFAALFIGLLSAAATLLFTGHSINMATLGYLQAVAGVLGIASKLPQIVAIFQSGTTGQLSAFTVFNYLAGSLSRIFTTLQEVDDKLILYGFIAGFALNLVLASQMVYYWNAPSAKAQGKRKAAPAKAKGKAAGASSATPKKSPATRRRG
ncbi:Putative Polyketide synthase [[Torrubiella] hemipterigena]|uniref:Mannose-P-dolichol utilization defect 1 protein homolog n=1 Tax=[Torrubiella] hemipterigena TaxID=1531966 RepID=A0A0A1TC79_9HYPO|nr:Putative Polyketide synthase [[Torrubiella] hemipterigena]